MLTFSTKALKALPKDIDASKKVVNATYIICDAVNVVDTGLPVVDVVSRFDKSILNEVKCKTMNYNDFI